MGKSVEQPTIGERFNLTSHEPSKGWEDRLEVGAEAVVPAEDEHLEHDGGGDGTNWFEAF